MGTAGERVTWENGRSPCSSNCFATRTSGRAGTRPEGDVAMLAPPFVVTEEELSEMAMVLDESLTSEGL